MARVETVVLLVVAGSLLASGIGGATMAAGAPTTQSSLPDSVTGTQADVDPDRVLLRADVRPNGTADWTIEYRILLDDQNTTDAFESVATEIRNDSTPYTDRFTERMQRTVASAENSTGREMDLRNVTVEADRQDIGQRYGIIRYRFSWTNFAVTNETHIEVGDSLAGFFLDGESQLRLGWPANYSLASVSPNATERLDSAVVWEGRRDFGPEGPRVVATTSTQGASSSSIGGTTLVGVAVVALVLGGGGYLLARRRGLFDRAEGASTATSASDTGPDEDAGPNSDGDADDTTDTETDDGPPAELLSNEEQVLKLLEEEGGRIKQQQVAQRLDWTDAKTSQVVSKLRENDEVDVFRLGRENVLTHPDDDSI